MLGTCTGTFAAAAISSARSLSELVPAGIEAVIVAFRTALRSLILRDDIEPINDVSTSSWSVVVSAQEVDIANRIGHFNQKSVSSRNK